MDKTPLYDYVMAQFRAKRVPQRQIAEGSGVPFSTICKIAQGTVKDPSVHTIQKLADYFATDPQPQTCHCCHHKEAA
jgi:transcriptional regulator with XRE-family HTH domain